MVPGSEKGGFGTQVNGISPNGIVIGVFTDPAGTLHTLLWIDGQPFTADFPKMPYTEAHSMNAQGDFTGAYATDPMGNVHGFLATPKSQ
jgi:hypothetical protein